MLADKLKEDCRQNQQGYAKFGLDPAVPNIFYLKHNVGTSLNYDLFLLAILMF